MGAIATPERLLSECGTNYSGYGNNNYVLFLHTFHYFPFPFQEKSEPSTIITTSSAAMTTSIVVTKTSTCGVSTSQEKLSCTSDSLNEPQVVPNNNVMKTNNTTTTTTTAMSSMVSR